MNQFQENENLHDQEEGSDFTYYVRPFIPFWSLQCLRFEDINNYCKVPAQREKRYPRYLMEKLVRTWLMKDKQWFDQENVFAALKEDIGAMLNSQYPSKKNLRKVLVTELWPIALFCQQRLLSWVEYIIRYEYQFYSTARKLCGIPEFSKHRILILDCWAIYHHINFQNEDIDVSFNFFPLWENSSDVRYLLIFLILILFATNSCIFFISLNSISIMR